MILVETSDEVEEYSWMNQLPTFDGSPRTKKTYRVSKNAKVDKYVKVGQVIPYIYDMGDYWGHLITVEKIIEDYPHVYPVCLEGEGACPPENCGGVGVYLDLLEIIKNPTHEEHEHLVEWLDENQYDASFDLEETNWWMKEDLKLKCPKK